MKHWLLLFLLGLLTYSCVSPEQLTYLQVDEEIKSDSVFYALQRSKYEVQPNDILSITVRSFDKETSELFNTSSTTQNVAAQAGDLLFYLNGYTVDFEGFIDMPVIGPINVAGNNVDEIKVLVQAELNNYFQENTVFVNVQLAGVRYSVVGDVLRPGKYVIYQNQVNVFEALAEAGDITLVGDRKQVQIVRQQGKGVITIDLDLTDSRVLSDPYFFIQPNDIINVKPLKVKSLGIGTTGFQTIASVLGVLASTATLIIAIESISN